MKNYFFVFFWMCLLVMISSYTPRDKTHVIPDSHCSDCKKIDVIRDIISEAISVGAPTYNEGNHIGCYRIYEGAAYKIIYKHGSKCKDVKNLLEEALEMSYGNYSASEKAWIMRIAFDKILGVPTVTK